MNRLGEEDPQPLPFVPFKNHVNRKKPTEREVLNNKGNKKRLSDIGKREYIEE